MAHLSQKGRHFRHRMKYDKSEVADNNCEPAAKTIQCLYFRKHRVAFGRSIWLVIQTKKEDSNNKNTTYSDDDCIQKPNYQLNDNLPMLDRSLRGVEVRRVA